ncbi:MAG: adenosylmethionine--8-amino-7-oxononanoate transaminase [Candidatus Margulisiibacteriota bacterium]|nr:MAG: adenosylmethionine--8-amino-7-oxononanoate transaminase [Candidatus Margulisbacteria bacterium GWD2_39_127]PZM84825.1 MAG: adenosylmethionine--8-amino-7-oxononanoate transaminase [Candidatus Margulisiibacteriota bacterium]HAR63302.1 adenosylmethionine--8-amino-7-oxononanoate transaminase [Candidatus Margulisiibacteriota bacterium]HCY36371.1 adenosylmethionine--8-amino-7-oxononanoate transaminase [Candidatus Margulisiibacteriota bacterium]
MDYKQLEALDKQYLWHPFTQMQDWLAQEPIIMAQGMGNYLFDVNGKKYLDAISSLWVNIHGHNRVEINEAIIRQVQTVSHSTLLGFANVPSILLAEKLVAIVPGDLVKVFYSDSGSTSVEIALKIAFQYWQQIATPQRNKTKFISFKNAYHGDTIGSVSVGGMDDFHETYKQLLFETYEAPYPYCYRCDSSESRCSNTCFYKLETIMKEHHEEIAGLIIEPRIQGASGMITSPPGFLKQVETLCREYGILLIVDEVATGFGRTGKMFSCEHEGVSPDIMCVAKGLTGGYLPLAATLTTEAVYQAFLGEYNEKKTFFHGHSYTGNQLACSAALASLDLFEKDRVIEKLQNKIALLTSLLVPFRDLCHVGDIRQQGLMVGIELVLDKRSKQAYGWNERTGISVCKDMLDKGFLLRPLGNVIVLVPPLSIAEEEIADLLENLKQSIIKVTGI